MLWTSRTFTAEMYRLLIEKQRRQLRYYLCTGLALWLSHEKNISAKEHEWLADVVKRTILLTTYDVE